MIAVVMTVIVKTVMRVIMITVTTVIVKTVLRVLKVSVMAMFIVVTVETFASDNYDDRADSDERYAVVTVSLRCTPLTYRQ